MGVQKIHKRTDEPHATGEATENHDDLRVRIVDRNVSDRMR